VSRQPPSRMKFDMIK